MGEPEFQHGSAEHAEAIQRAVDGRNDMVHASFTYGCRQCGHERQIYLGVGIEGPLSLRERRLYLASPFGGPPCPQCTGTEVYHVQWQRDRHFEPIDAPPGCTYFAVPRGPIDLTRFLSVAFCGETKVAPGGTR